MIVYACCHPTVVSESFTHHTKEEYYNEKLQKHLDSVSAPLGKKSNKRFCPEDR
jgi:hypothetical protein